MKNWLAMLVVVISLVGLGIADTAEAKRLGGGVSSGLSRNNVMKRDAAPPAPVAPAQNAAAAALPATPAPIAPAPARSGMWGMLGGLALGVGLGALLSHFGLGAEFGGLLMVLLLVFGAVILFKWFTRSQQPATAPLQYAGGGASAAEPLKFEPVAITGSGEPQAPTSVPPGFDIAGFLRQAKLNFIRLQTANDASNLDDIRQFTSPEMYAEIQLQLDERGRAKQETDVVQLDAELLDLTTEVQCHLASVRFHGLIKETAAGSPEPFEEVWHLSKPSDGSTGWVVAGIQQFA
jgi:predicted lipid-binding transport protein (Tim44 family)